MANFTIWHKSVLRFKRGLLCSALLANTLLLSACGEVSDSDTNKKLLVATTFTVIADIARNVAGDTADVVSVTKAGAEIHNYQPTPQDIVRTDKADLVLWNGLGLELWFEKFLEQLGDVPNVTVTDGIDPIDIHKGPYSGKPNPHAWMSLSNALIYVDNISNAMAKADPDNADTYRKNAEEYKTRIEQISAPLRAQIATIPEAQRWLVSSEGAFSYLAKDFGLKELFLWPINADQQGTPSQVRNVIDMVNEHNIRTVFSESTISPKPAQQVARETGAHYGGILYVDSLSEADGPVPTYLDLIKKTTNTVVTGLLVERSN